MTSVFRETSVRPGDEPRKVVVQLAQYGETRTVSDGPGMPQYREQFESVRPAERFHVKDSHAGVLIGHGDPATFRETPNPEIEMTIADTAAGRDILALVESGTINSVSMEFNPKSGETVDIDGVTVRSGTAVLGAAFAYSPAHTAPILATREETEMTETPAPTPDAVTADVLNREMDGLRDEVTRTVAAATAAASVQTANPYADLMAFRDIGTFVQSAFSSPELTELSTRALADNITGDNPGVILPTWIKDIKGVVDANRATINAFGTGALPPSGMQVEFPYSNQAITDLVGEQSTEKTAVTSVTISVLQGTQAIQTFAGGADNSVQLIQRSDPAYLTHWMRMMASGMSATTDAAMSVKAAASATAGTAWALGGTLPEFTESLVDASISIEAATGSPASFVLAGSTAFAAIAKLEGLYPPQYGTQNVLGEASAASLNVTISGVPVIHSKFLEASTILVSNSMTADYLHSGTQTISAPNVELLGQDVAIYEMGATVVYTGAGIINIPAA